MLQQYMKRTVFEQCNSLSLSVNTVNPGLEGCGALGLEKDPIDGGISQGALCLWSLGQSALFQTPPAERPRMTLTPQWRVWRVWTETYNI